MKKLLVVGVCVLSLFIFFIVSVADNISELQGVKESLEAKRVDALRQLKQQESALNSDTVRINRLMEQYGRYKTLIDELQEDRDERLKELKVLEKRLKETIESYENSKEIFRTRVKAMYKGANKTALDVIIEAENLAELTSRVQLLNKIAKRDTKIIQDFIHAQEELEVKEKQLQESIADILTRIDATNVTVEDIRRNQELLERQMDERNDRIDILKRQERQLLEESKGIEERIKQMKLSAQQYVGGQMRWPVPSSRRITSYFGVRQHPVFGYSRMHTGIDIAANQGVNIIAANTGKVMISGWEGGYGNTVLIDHGGGISTLYAHCSSLLVSEGQSVEVGDVIARIGSTGVSTGPHLHFEVRKNGEPVDPMNYLGS